MKQFKINTGINTEFLDQAELELYSVYQDCLAEYGKGFHFHPKIYSASLLYIKASSLLGLIVPSLFILTGKQLFDSTPIDIAVIVVSLFLLILSWNINKLKDRKRSLYRSYWQWLARVRTNTMLKTAKKTAPFIAEYDMRGDLAVYYRTQAEKSAFIWSRKIDGFRLSKNNFTLFFKKEKSIYPYAIILHEPSEEFASYLDALGVKPLSRSASDGRDHISVTL